MTVLTIITAWAEWHFRRRYGPTSRLGTGSWYGRLAEWAMGQHSVGCTWTRREEAPVARTVSQTHTHTHMHTRTVSLTYTPCLSHIHTRTMSHTHTHTHSSLTLFPVWLALPWKGQAGTTRALLGLPQSLWARESSPVLLLLSPRHPAGPSDTKAPVFTPRLGTAWEVT